MSNLGHCAHSRNSCALQYLPRESTDINAQVGSSADYAEESPAWSKDVQEATPADGDEDQTLCTERWKAAQSDNVKRMWSIYRETGIFLSACRHGVIWWICDMVTSGELYVHFVHSVTTLTTSSVLNIHSRLSIKCLKCYRTGQGLVTTLVVHSQRR